MKFHYEFDIKGLDRPITHRDKLFLIGSCFTENMGAKLKNYKFSVLENPNGILFNPVSVVEALETYLSLKKYSEEDLFFLNESWHSWKHHSRFSGLRPEEVLEKMNNAIINAHDRLKSASHLVITLGSAWIYSLTDKAANAAAGSVAANNHKAPAEWFERSLMKQDEVKNILQQTLQHLFEFNQDLHVLFTISPVRHLREGVVENNRSKAVLILAVHEIVEKFSQAHYFPAYELVIDDLRDYRFYAEDLVHPNYAATEYVWEKFAEACMDEKTRSLLKEIHAINLAYKHKAFNPSSSQHGKFLEGFYQKTKQIQGQFPYLDFERELEYFNRGLRGF